MLFLVMDDQCGLRRKKTVDDSHGWNIHIHRLLYLVIFGLGFLSNHLTAKEKKCLS